MQVFKQLTIYIKTNKFKSKQNNVIKVTFFLKKYCCRVKETTEVLSRTTETYSQNFDDIYFFKFHALSV